MDHKDDRDGRSQKAAFVHSEGDAWFDRNRGQAHPSEASDSILAAFASVQAEGPGNVLEVGCADGWRLSVLQRRYRYRCFGIDPSAEAISRGRARFEKIHLSIGTADQLPFPAGRFDVVVLGFCLYLCDRGDLFKIAWEVDRVLADTGRIFIFDFDPPFAYKNRYAHLPGLYSYKMPYADMFLWNPAYNRIYHRSHSHRSSGFHPDPNERIAVSVLAKNTQDAYPEHPFG